MSYESVARRHALASVGRAVAIHAPMMAAWFVTGSEDDLSLSASWPVILVVAIGVPLLVTLVLPLSFVADRISPRLRPAASTRRFENVTEEVAIGLGEQVESIRTHDAEGTNILSLPTSEGEVVVATSAALEQLSRRELQAVVAAQFAGLRDRWCRLATRAEIMWWAARVPIALSSLGFVVGRGAATFVGFMAIFVLVFVPRFTEQARDLCADLAAVRFTFDPEALGSAMRTIGADPDASHDVDLSTWWLPVNPFLLLPKRVKATTTVSGRGETRVWQAADEVALEFELRADRAVALAAGADPADYSGREFRRRWAKLGTSD